MFVLNTYIVFEMGILAILIGIFVLIFVSLGFILISQVYHDIEQLEGKIKDDKQKSFWDRFSAMIYYGY